MATFDTAALPTYDTGATTIRIPKSCTVVLVEVYAPTTSPHRERARARALEGGGTYSTFNRCQLDWLIFQSLEAAESLGYVEVVPEQDGGKLVILREHLVNLVLA